jgi:NADPH:quinone reductase
MRAAVCPAYGPPEVVRIDERPSPTVAPGQVRVKVSAAAVNFPDVLLIANEYQISVPPPFVPGSEYAGVIVETGEGAEGFAVGSRVTGTGLYGAFAEEVVVPSAKLSRTVSTSAPQRRWAWRIGRPITRCGRSPVCTRATS